MIWVMACNLTYANSELSINYHAFNRFCLFLTFVCVLISFYQQRTINEFTQIVHRVLLPACSKFTFFTLFGDLDSWLLLH